MGSIEKACISGFLCRLCSEMHRTVIHIYGDHGQRLCLVEKINGYLPITISPTDPLPKTICKTCLYRVEQHYTLLMRLTRMREERKLRLLDYKTKRDTDDFSISSVECSDDEETTSPRPAKKSKTNKSTAAKNRSVRNNDNLETAGTSRGQRLSTVTTGTRRSPENDPQENNPAT